MCRLYAFCKLSTLHNRLLNSAQNTADSHPHTPTNTHNMTTIGARVLTRRAMYVLRNIEVRSRNHYCSGKAISITYSECVLVALLIQHVTRISHIAICGLPRSTIFAISHKRNAFRGEKKLLNIKCVF
jgi:hypothetical protein